MSIASGSAGNFRRNAAKTVAAAVALAFCAGNASAQVANFNTLTAPGNDIRYVTNCYVEANLRFTVVGDACNVADSFASWGSANAGFYTGSPALFNNSATGTAIDITRSAGGLFSLTSIDLTSFLGLSGNATTVAFLGTLGAGGTVARSVNILGGITTPTNIQFANFTGLSSVRLTVTTPSFEPYVQFDNVTTVFATSTVPEPSTVMLTGTALLALGLFARARRKA